MRLLIDKAPLISDTLSSSLHPQCDTLCALALGAKAIENRHLVARKELHIDAAECAGGAAQVSRPTWAYPSRDLLHLYYSFHSADYLPIYRAPRVLLHSTWAPSQRLPSYRPCSRGRTTSRPAAAAKQGIPPLPLSPFRSSNRV